MSNIFFHVLPGLRLHGLDLPNPLPISLIAAHYLMSWEESRQSGGFHVWLNFLSVEFNLDNCEEEIPCSHLCQSWLASTVTQRRVDTHIHYNHQVGGLTEASSANTSLHIEFCRNLIIKVQGCQAESKGNNYLCGSPPFREPAWEKFCFVSFLKHSERW